MAAGRSGVDHHPGQGHGPVQPGGGGGVLGGVRVLRAEAGGDGEPLLEVDLLLLQPLRVLLGLDLLLPEFGREMSLLVVELPLVEQSEVLLGTVTGLEK